MPRSSAVGSKATGLLLATALMGSRLACHAAGAEARRVAIRAPRDLLGPEFERSAGWARRRGIEIEIGPENAPVPLGWESVRLTGIPLSPDFRRLLARFPIRVEENGFVFDGRAYRDPEDAILLADPSSPAETFVLGNSRQAILRILSRRFFWREGRISDYAVVSGELSKEGRFLRGQTPLAVDRRSDQDQVTAREEFFGSLRTEERAGVRWRFREPERAGVSRWEPVLRRFWRNGEAGVLSISFFPDPAVKGRYTGSSRPADLYRQGREVRVDIDVSAPKEPDLVSPVLAAAAFSAAQPRLLSRPMLLLAMGARAHGRWWGREVASFGSFVRQARVEPSIEEIVKSDEEVSPIFSIGAAASWLEAGARSEGESAVLRALAAEDSELLRALKRWAEIASRARVAAPPRRGLPAGFLRGLSYAMSNSIEGSYASPRSRETLERLSKMSVNSISVMPFAFSPDANRPALSFIHRRPSGETDEGTVRAISDARNFGMSAMVKPQIWLPGAFVGEVSMRSDGEWRGWFDRYRRFIVHHAVVVEASGAALFCVGTELVGTEQRESQWREVIGAVRLATGAPLLYASNWAAGAPRVPFWDALDAIGVDFYDSLSKDPAASDAALAEGVRAAARPLEALARRNGKPVIFAEAGYPPVRAAWITPHDESSGRAAAPGDAARSIAAVFRVLEREGWWKGVYWWKAFSSGAPARPQDRDFNVLGAPAEKVIVEGFERLARERDR